MREIPLESAGNCFSSTPYVLFLIFVFFVLSLSFTLYPSVEGHGTHRQLGLPPCGFLTVTGYPCPSCGLTTSFSHIVMGNWIDALRTQPFGPVLFALMMIVGMICVVSIIKKIPVSRYLDSSVFDRVQVVLLILFMSSWLYKIIQMRG